MTQQNNRKPRKRKPQTQQTIEAEVIPSEPTVEIQHEQQSNTVQINIDLERLAVAVVAAIFRAIK